MLDSLLTVWRSFVTRSTVAGSLAALVLLASSCKSGRDEYPTIGPAPTSTSGPGKLDCANPREGCKCPEEGKEIECGETQSVNSDYRTCAIGTRVCTEGIWSACAISDLRQQSLTRGLGQKLQGAGNPEICTPSYDPCDPYCNQVVDVPDNTITVPPGFQITPSGLTLIETGTAGCTSLVLAPVVGKVEAPTNRVTVTAFSPLAITPAGTAATPVTFTLTALPMGCVASGFTTTWTTNKPDRALMSVSGGKNSNNTNGELTIAIPYAGPIQVTAYAQGLSASTTINVKVNVVDATASAPNVAATSGASGQQRRFFTTGTAVADYWANPLPGTVANSVDWLYPYENTFFPLGLPAPIVQYWYRDSTGGGTESSVAMTDRAVKVSLRYPTGRSSVPSAMNYSDFNYSLIAKESNTTSQTASVAEDARDPQITIPQNAWNFFEQTARGNNAEIVIQRLRGTTLEQETRRVVRPVDGQLKGTIYYNSYSSPQGSNTGAILKIAPGATTPTLAVQPSGCPGATACCTVCHTLNLEGTHLISNTGAGPGSGVNQAQRFNMGTTGPSPMVTHNYPGVASPPASGLSTTTTQTGPNPPTAPTSPTVTITGVPATDGFGLIRITTAGVRGTSRFSWSFEAQSEVNIPTQASYVLGSTGLTANFNTGTYALNTTYDWGSSRLTGSEMGQYWANRLGDRFTFGGPRTDGQFYMTHGGRRVGAGGVGVGDTNFRAPPDFSNLYSIGNTNQIVPVTNWPPDMLAVTPRFSHDGGKLVFGFWGGSTLPTTPAGGLNAAPAGTRLTVADFALTCTTPPCTGTSPGLTASASNVRDLTPGFTERVGWPTFTPTADAVIYQRQYRTSKSKTEFADVVQTGSGPAITLSGTPVAAATGVGRITITTGGTRAATQFSWSLGTFSGTLNANAGSVVLTGTGITANFPNSPPNYVVGTVYSFDVGIIGTPPGWVNWPGWSPSHMNSSAGALAELWLSKVPATSGSAAVPTRLFALNGLNTNGTSYLPEDTRPMVTPASFTPYHRNTGTSFTITQADHCTNTGVANNVYDHRLNYLPAFNPVSAGGYSWVVFTSRRMYGNIAYNDPWDAISGSCDSGAPPTKKLWVAAIDTSITAGTDPSHPAFYLPGQELAAGNANAEWVNTPCSATGMACSSNDDCCGATGASPTTSCKVTSATTVPPTRTCQLLTSCSSSGQACTTTADCCTGGTCPAGGGVCITVMPPIFVQKTYTREYLATCPTGTDVKWRYLEWQATIPASTSIVFRGQTKAAAGDTYLPAMAVTLGTASTTTAAGTWTRSTTTVDTALVTNGVGSRNYLLVTMTFNPNMAGSLAPTLQNWRQIYDCVPAE